MDSLEVTDSLLSTCAEVLCCTILGMVYGYNGGSQVVPKENYKVQLL